MKKLYLNEIAKQFNLTEATIRFYDEKGLLPFLKREANGYRYLNEIDLPWVEVIVCLKKTGMALKGIKEYISLCLEGQSTITTRQAMIINQKAIVESKIVELQNELNFLKEKETYYQKLISRETGIKDHLHSYSE